MRHRGLLHRYCRFEIADAHPTFIPGEYVEQLQPHGVGELLELSRQLCRCRIGAARASADITAAFTELAIDYLECSWHDGTLPSISTIVNIPSEEGGRRKEKEDEDAGSGTSKGCNVGVLQRPSTGVACASPIQCPIGKQCATTLPEPSATCRQNAAFLEKSDGQESAEFNFEALVADTTIRAEFFGRALEPDLLGTGDYSTVTLLARLRGWSTFDPRFTAT